MECKGSEFLIFSFFPQIQPILKKRADVDQDPEHWLGEESFRHKAFLPSILNKQCDKKKYYNKRTIEGELRLILSKN